MPLDEVRRAEIAEMGSRRLEQLRLDWRTSRSGATKLSWIAPLALLALLGCSGDPADSPSDGPLAGDGVVIEGAPGNVVCVPGAITIRNTAKTPRVIWGLDGENRVLGPGESLTEPLDYRVPDELNVIKVGTFLRRQTIRLLARGERLDLPTSIKFKTPATSGVGAGMLGTLLLENPSDHTMWVTFATTGGLVTGNQRLLLMPHEASGTSLGMPLPLVDPKAGLRTRIEVVTGDCEPVSTFVDVEVAP